MLVAIIEGATREIGKSQGYFGLPVKDIILPDGTPMMQTAWTPTPDELAALQAGANIIVTL